MGKAARDASRKHGEGWGREASHSTIWTPGRHRLVFFYNWVDARPANLPKGWGLERRSKKGFLLLRNNRMSPFFQRLTNKVAMPTYTPSHHEGGIGGGKERRTLLTLTFFQPEKLLLLTPQWVRFVSKADSNWTESRSKGGETLCTHQHSSHR